ncbi:fumarate hydratase alpha subunit [Desmospora sp. 8437]|nr:fumarate hydratase alpha subunit [Desmospora sp. 8437]
MRELKESLLQLITETSTNLPPDVRHAIAKAKKKKMPVPGPHWP